MNNSILVEEILDLVTIVAALESKGVSYHVTKVSGVWAVHITDWLSKPGLAPIDPRYQECVDKGHKFFSDISSQLGGVVIQDYQNMNEFAILLAQLCEES